MKVVIFCGGLGMRLREYSESIPKPMVPIGNVPMLLLLMKYYAFFGHKEFILCLGYKGHVIKDFFLHYNECLDNDFIIDGNKEPTLLQKGIGNWKITFIDTGLNSNIGMRLKAVEKYLADDEAFLANYADALCNVPFPDMHEFFKRKNKIACFLCTQPAQTFHYVKMNESGTVKSIRDTTNIGLTVNGGFFIFKKEIFDYIRYGEELVHEPFQRLIEAEQLVAYKYEGFWVCMDTFKDKQKFDQLHSSGKSPWEVWRAKNKT